MARWAFPLTGVAFFIAGLAPMMRGRDLNVAFFTLGILFLLLGAKAARRTRTGDAEDEGSGGGRPPV